MCYMKIKKAKETINSKEGQVQLAIFKFSQDKYFNGQTIVQILDDPEVSLSPKNQVKLAEEINQIQYFYEFNL